MPNNMPPTARRTGNPWPIKGAGTTAVVGVIVIVSTKKSHPFSAASGVVIVTEVIGSVALGVVREKLPNALVEVLPGMPVNVLAATKIRPENGLWRLEWHVTDDSRPCPRCP